MLNAEQKVGARHEDFASLMMRLSESAEVLTGVEEEKTLEHRHAFRVNPLQ